MSIEELLQSNKDFLTPVEVSKILHSDPQVIRTTARQAPHLIGYPYTFIGNRMKIPRLGFIAWLTKSQ